MDSLVHLSTILIVQEDRDFREALVMKLKEEGHVVLAAANRDEALKVVKTHSRRINLLVIDDSATSQETAASLKPYRRFMNVLFLNSVATEGIGEPLGVDVVLAKVREILALGEAGEKDVTRDPNRSKSAMA